MIWRRLCEIFSSEGAERKVFKMLSWLLMPRPRPPTPAEIMLFPMMLKLPDPSIAIKELLFVGQFVYLPRNHDLERVNQTGKMENGHGHLIGEDEDTDEIIVLSDSEELASKRSSPVSVVMPCTSSTDAVRPGRGRRKRTRAYNIEVSYERHTPRAIHSSGAVICIYNGENGAAEDNDMSDEQPRDLRVTLRSNDNAGNPADWVIEKPQDEVDRFLPCAGVVLRSIQDEQLQLQLMADIMQILIDAKKHEEMQTLDQPLLQYNVILFTAPPLNNKENYIFNPCIIYLGTLLL